MLNLFVQFTINKICYATMTNYANGLSLESQLYIHKNPCVF